MRKLVASGLIVITLWGSLIQPARALPVLPLVAYLIEVAGAHPLLTSVAIHAGIAAITLTDNGAAPTSNGSNAAIQIQLDPYTPLIKPESAIGAAVIDATSQEVIASENHYYWRKTYSGQVFQGYTVAEVATAYFNYAKNVVHAGDIDCPTSNVHSFNEATGQFSVQKCPGFSNVSDTVFKQNNQCVPGDTWNGSACVRNELVCPSNYTLNSGDNKCYANNPDEVQVADAKLQIQRTLDKFQKNPNDPDPVPDNVSISDKEVVVRTPERTTTVKINDDSSVDIKEVVQTPDGNTEENKVKVSAPTPGNAPEVQSKSSSKYPGQSTANGGAAVPGTGTGESGTPNAPATPTTVLNLPDNLARTDKQCGYDDAHPCKVEIQGDGKLKIDEEGTPGEFTSEHGDQIDAKFDELETFIENQTDGVGQGLENPLIGKLTSGGCTNPEFNVSEVNANAKSTIPICDYIPDLHPWLALFAYVMSALAIYRIWFTRTGGNA
jgi:hypothetical protein